MAIGLRIQGWLMGWNNNMTMPNKCIWFIVESNVANKNHHNLVIVYPTCLISLYSQSPLLSTFLYSLHGDSLAYCFLMEVKSHGRNYWCKFVLVFHIPINELIPYAFDAGGMFDQFFPDVSHFHHLLDGDGVCLEHLNWPLLNKVSLLLISPSHNLQNL